MKKTAFFSLCLGMMVMLGNTTGVAHPTQPGAQTFFAEPIEGAWDINVDADGKTLPAWLEVKKSGSRTLVAQIMLVTGSARPVSKVNYSNGEFSFSFPPQWEDGDKDFVMEGEVKGETIEGTVNTSEGKVYKWKGVRAPQLTREGTPKWGKPIKLLNGKDLSGWKPMGAENQWVVENGILKSPKSGANLVSEQKFEDFKLHIEFRYQKGSNSGIYLRGRYEVQVQDDKGKEPESHLFGGVYGFLTPNQMAAKDAGEWQSYDITLVGRLITIVANGKEIICNQLIPGITGGALDSNEGEPGPLYLQGDHGPIEYRNIIITPAVK